MTDEMEWELLCYICTCIHTSIRDWDTHSLQETELRPKLRLELELELAVGQTGEATAQKIT